MQKSKKLEKKKVIMRRHNNCSLIVPTNVLSSDVESFEEGKLKYYFKHCEKYTSDTFMLDITKNGLKLDFNEILIQHFWINIPL